MPGSGENKSDKSRVNMAWHQTVGCDYKKRTKFVVSR